MVEFTPAQLAAGGLITPNLTLTSTIAFTGSWGFAFSPVTGNLWVANNGGTSIEGFAAASLAGLTGAQTIAPHDVLNDDGAGSIQGPWALVFDTAGNLWSSNANTPFTIVEFLATQLGRRRRRASGTEYYDFADHHRRQYDLECAQRPGLRQPRRPLGGQLGYAVRYSDYGANQLTSSGATVPNVFLVGATTTLNAPAGDVFGPLVP